MPESEYSPKIASFEEFFSGPEIFRESSSHCYLPSTISESFRKILCQKFSNFSSNLFNVNWTILSYFSKSLEVWWPGWGKWKSGVSNFSLTIYFHALDHSEWSEAICFSMNPGSFTIKQFFYLFWKFEKNPWTRYKKKVTKNAVFLWYFEWAWILFPKNRRVRFLPLIVRNFHAKN